jgi:hypothetical protein
MVTQPYLDGRISEFEADSDPKESTPGQNENIQEANITKVAT